MKKIIYFLSALTLLFFSACNNNNALPVPVTDIAFEPALPTKSISLTIGKTYQLKAKVKPDNATNKTLTYTSDNPTIASVNDKGVITAHKTGSAKITVKAAGGIAKDITVTITPKPEMPIAVRSIELSPNEDTISLVKGTSHQLNVQVKPENAADKKLSFSSSDEGIASINGEGLVTAKAVGNANITINAANGVSKILKVTVTAAPVAVTGIVFESALPGDPLPLSIGGTYQLRAKVQPENATDKKLSYTSDNEGVVVVNDKGLITAKTVGSAKITVKASNGVSKEVTVKVTVEHIPVMDIALSPDETTLSLMNGETRQINAHVEPGNATNKNLTYSSDDETVAFVNDKGEITAKQVGNTGITITAADNPAVSKKLMLTVTKATVRVTSIEFNPPLPTEPIELVIGQVYKFGAKVTPDNASNKKLTFTTSNSSIAWLQGNGNSEVKADGIGEATVTITADDNPTIRKVVQFKMKQKPEIKIDAIFLSCESSGGEATFTVKTVDGKLDYTPEVVGGGTGEKAWLTFVRKDNTDANTDTVHLSLKQNKTVWDRTARIRFKDNITNKYIEISRKKYLEVQLTQKKNENPNVTIKWVYGITPPTNAEKEKIEILEKGVPTGKYHNADYAFYWAETLTTTFFNTRKVDYLHTPNSGDTDSNQCWAKTDSNMLHWWFEQNNEHVEKYIEKKGITVADTEKYHMYKPVYTRGLEDNQEEQKSSIANLFREKCINKGGDPANGLQWYLFGLNGFKNAKNKSYSPALFPDVFNEGNTPIERATIYTKKEFEDTLNAALASEKAVGLNRYGADGSQHAITLWGAAFDEDGNIIVIYVGDNNDVSNKIVPYGIWYKNGVDIYAETEPVIDSNDPHYFNPYFFNYSNNSYNDNHYVGQIITLDKGEAQWLDWLSKH